MIELLPSGGVEMQTYGKWSMAGSFIAMSLFLICGVCDAVEVENYRNFNQIIELASYGETIAIGTTCGALVWDGESLIELSTDTGMSFSQTCCVDVAPDGSVWVGGWSLSRYAEGEFLNFDQFHGAYSIAAVSKDEAWVVGAMPGNYYDRLFHIDAGEVKTIEIDDYPGGLILDGFGNVFCIAGGSILRFDEFSGTFIECPGFDVNVYRFARDASGFAYVASDQGLWGFNGDKWRKIENGSVWAPLPNGPNGFSFDEDGTLWADASAGLLRRDAQGSELFTEACGISLVYDPYDDSTWQNGVWGIAPMGGASMVFGTRADGLLMFDGEQFSHIGFADGPPDNIINELIEDFHGRNWVAPYMGAMGTGYIDGSAWKYFDAEGVFGFLGVLATCVNTNGSVHFLQRPGRLISFDGVEFAVQEGYDHGITDCVGVQMEPAAGGEIWASFEGSRAYDFSGVARISGDEWELFPTDDHFPQYSAGASADDDRMPTIVIASDDSVWLILGSFIRRYDGHSWGNDSLPMPMPFAQADVSGAVFDIQQRLVFFTSEGVYRLDGGNWIRLSDEIAREGMIDSGGALWFIAYDAETRHNSLITLKPNGTTIEMDHTDGLADRRLYSVSIDHNGDKWVGTSGGLSRVEDGGPAQQAIELSTNVNPEGILTVSAQLTNAGEIIPVSLWLACEFGGALYYYPDWGPAPTPLNLTLSASSYQNHELFNMDTSSLPQGDYTFYGGISLLGGMDLLIGARGAKIAVATYHKEWSVGGWQLAVGGQGR